MEKRKYLVYKIINKQNSKIYIGVHTTDDENDNYMGSGKRLKEDIKEYGLENFEKMILHRFDTEQEMLDKERELVNEAFIARDDTYNVILGGGNFLTLNTVPVKDKNENYFRVHINDPRYQSGELVHVAKNKVTVKDEYGNTMMVDKDEPKYLSGELVPITKGKVVVKDYHGNIIIVDIDDPKYLSGELVSANKGLIGVKDEYGNTTAVDKNDPRYLSGELFPFWKNKKHNKETKKKIGEANSQYQKGTKNSQYGTMWIHNKDLQQNKKIRKDEPIPEGWEKGRIQLQNQLSSETINQRINDYYNEKNTENYKDKLARKWNISRGQVRKFLKYQKLI